MPSAMHSVGRRQPVHLWQIISWLLVPVGMDPDDINAAIILKLTLVVLVWRFFRKSVI